MLDWSDFWQWRKQAEPLPPSRIALVKRLPRKPPMQRNAGEQDALPSGWQRQAEGGRRI